MMLRTWLITLLFLLQATPANAQVIADVEPRPIPAGTDVFDLTLKQTRAFSLARNFELVGHSYLKVPQRTAFAKTNHPNGSELGSGTSSIAVYDGIAYVAGYNFPPTLFGIQLVDVRDPANMKPLGFVPCNAGTRCPYLRVDRKRKLLIFGNDPDTTNPSQPSAGTVAKAGWTFVDVADPRAPRTVGFLPVPAGATTHGLEIDGRYLYGCGGIRAGMDREAMQIIDYRDPRKPVEVATWHVEGMLPGETANALNRKDAQGQDQILQCHEIVYHDNRLYTAWRDAGLIIFEIRDRAKPTPVFTYDYVPPFSGGRLGAAHTALPVVNDPREVPRILVAVDEIFDCPTGFARIIDISDLASPEVRDGGREAVAQVLSTIRSVHQDRIDASGKLTCDMPLTGPSGGTSHSVHLPMLDSRSKNLLYLTWYNEGLRAIDISNPYNPREVGFFLSPAYTAPGGYMLPANRLALPRTGRQTREVFQDPDTKLLYITDGNGGGLFALRYTGPMPAVSVPGAR